MSLKKAVVTGLTGQDGAYLAKFLLENGYHVVGTYRRTSTDNFWRLNYLGIRNHPMLSLYEFDLTDLSSCVRLVSESVPDEIYNLAAQSFVGASFEQPVTTAQITGVGALNLLEAIRITGSKSKFYQASTSELYGMVQEVPQSELTPFYPRSPYGVAKLFAHWATINYHESYGIHACTGILFNHESPLRGAEFVTRKITCGVANYKFGSREPVSLGNLNARRDWGFAGDYVEGMWRILQSEIPDNYVLATGKTYTVRDFASLACSAAGIDVVWEGEGVDEIGIDKKNGSTIFSVSSAFYRPAEVDLLVGNPLKAKQMLGWEAKTQVDELARIMVDSDIKRIQ